MSDNFDIGITVCRCMRWWLTLREAIQLHGYECVNGVKSCDYCRDDEKYLESEEDNE